MTEFTDYPMYIKTPTSSLKWRAGLSRARKGSGRARIYCPGDSKTAGATRAISYPDQLKAYLKRRGVQAQTESMCGDANTASTSLYTTYNPRLTFSGGVIYDGGRFSLGRAPWRGDGTTETWTWTPAENCDTHKVRYMKVQGGGSASVTIGGAAPATGGSVINAQTGASASLAWGEITFTSASPSTAPLVISKSVAGGFFIGEILSWDSTKPGVDIINAGWPTAKTADFADLNAQQVAGAFSPLNTIDFVAPSTDLAILAILANDIDNGVALATALANLTTIVARWKANGVDVLMVQQTQNNPLRNAFNDAANQALYWAGALQIARTYDCMYANVQAMFGPWSLANSRGVMADDIHENLLGYSIVGEDVIGPTLFG